MDLGKRAAVAIPALVALLLAWQLLVPPVVGLANNGDFAKVASFYSLVPERAGDEFIHVVTKWRVDPARFWDSEFRTTEHLHGAVTRLLGGDIRWQGVTHGAVMIAAIALLAASIGWRALLAIPLLFDLAYSAYFNSMYMDAAAMVWLALSIGAMIAGRWWLACAAAVLFFGAKSAHAIPGIVLIGAVLVHKRWAIAAIELAAMVWTVTRISPECGGQAMYNLIFTKAAAHATDGDFQRIALRLGVREDELRWKGTTAFDANVPAHSRPWIVEFAHRIPTTKMIDLYWHDPHLVWRFAANDLREEAHRIRPIHLGNYDRSSGREPGEKAGGPLSWWSAFRSWLIRIAPWHLPVLYAGIGAWLVARRRLLTLPALLWAMALMEFGISTLADACETSRHLILFHWLTDALILYFGVTSLPGESRE